MSTPTNPSPWVQPTGGPSGSHPGTKSEYPIPSAGRPPTPTAPPTSPDKNAELGDLPTGK